MSASTTDWLRLREQDLVGKIAVITGASKGIGRAIALNLASRGCSVLGTCSSPDTLDLIDTLSHSVVDLYAGKGLPSPKIVGVVADILSPDCATAVINGLDKSFDGHVDIFINNAAHTGMSPVGEMDAEQIQKYTIGNIQTPVLTVEELVKRKMFRKESRIIYISSQRSKMSSAATTLYCATKAAGESLVRCWADAFGGKEERFAFMSGTTANSVFVGITATEAINRQSPEVVERLKSIHVPMQSIPRVAEPEDVADVVGMLCSREARWITGSLVSADGGGFKIC